MTHILSSHFFSVLFLTCRILFYTYYFILCANEVIEFNEAKNMSLMLFFSFFSLFLHFNGSETNFGSWHQYKKKRKNSDNDNINHHLTVILAPPPIDVYLIIFYYELFFLLILYTFALVTFLSQLQLTTLRKTWRHVSKIIKKKRIIIMCNLI